MRKLLTLVCAVTLTMQSFAQIVNVGGPVSFNGKITSPVVYEDMPGFDLRQAQLEDSINDANKVGPWRFGYLYDVDLTPDNSGTIESLPNGAQLWRVGIRCENALSVNLIFTEFDMPEGAHVHLYNPDHSQVIGAYSSRNNNDEKVLGTELILGQELVVEYYLPADKVSQGALKIGHVTHGYRSLGKYASDLQDQMERAYNSSGACNVDALCTNFADPAGAWGNPIKSVAMIVSGGNGVCTGALINNTCDNGTPYFLTANHCLGGSSAPGTMSWAFRFNWQRDPAVDGVECPTGTGGNPGATYDETAYGAALRANNSNSDFALLEISNMTVTDAQNYGAFYAGWDNTDATTVTEVTGIHHPSGDIKKKCRYNSAPTHNTTAGAEVWWINDWDNGVTEPGSSGSPLFDQNQRIIGQLYGGAAACSGTTDNGQYDYYGRLGVSWNAISGNTNSLEYWLDGDAGGCATSGTTVNDGWDPNQPSVSDDAGIQSVSVPTGSYCGGSFDPEVSLRNYGTNTLTQVDIIYDIGGVSPQTYNWTGNLASGTSVTVTLPTMTPSAGGNLTFNAATDSPNGTTDNNTSNDAASSSFSYVANPVNVTVDIILDDYGTETTWEILDGGSVVANGGPYQDNMDQTLESTTVCLEDGGCYDFVIYDSYGDGICCAYGNGSYTVTEDATGTTLASGGSFANDETTNFCFTPQSLTASFTASSTSVCAGESIDFTDQSTGGATSWTWTFNGAATSSSTDQNPTGIVYNTPGTYDVTLSVSDGSTTDDSTATAYIIVNPNPAVTSTGTDVTCYEANDGSATATASGGTSPYSYNWSPSGGTGATATGLAPGTYTVDITDANGCTAQDMVTITEPTQLQGSLNSSTDANCGASDGAATLSATGGTAAYEYSEDGTSYQSNSTISGLAAGTYVLYVRDANGCTDTVQVTIDNPNAPVLTLSANDECCASSCDGDATATPSGGIPSYSYAWDAAAGSQTTQTATGLCAGTYSVTVTDGAGCQSMETVVVNSGAAPVAAATPSATTVYLNQGGDVTFTDNSTGAVSYDWDFGDGNTSTSASPTHTYTSSGTYTVTLTVTNSCGCTDTETFTIIVEQTDGIEDHNSIDVMLFPNPSDGVLYLMSYSSLSNVQVDVMDAQGKLVYTSGSMTLAKGRSERIDLNVSKGMYMVRVVGEEGATVKRVFIR